MPKPLLWIFILTLASLACVAQSQIPTLSPTATKAATAEPTAQIYTVTGDLYIRTGAGTEYPALKEVLHAGDTVTCIEWDGNWCRHSLGWSNGGWLR